MPQAPLSREALGAVAPGLLAGGGAALRGFEPRLARLAPPLMEVTDAEMLWINPDYAPRLAWEGALCQDNSKGAEVRELMSKAFKGALKVSGGAAARAAGGHQKHCPAGAGHRCRASVPGTLGPCRVT